MTPTTYGDVDQATSHRLPSLGLTAFGSFGHQHGSFLQDPWIVVADVWQEFSRRNMISYEFITSHMNFTLNEHVKLDETYLDTQGHFRVTHLNVIDVLGCLTSKLHKTWHNAYKWHNNSFKDIKTSLITHKHIEPHMRHMSDLVVERHSHPLTFEFQCTQTLHTASISHYRPI